MDGFIEDLIDGVAEEYGNHLKIGMITTEPATGIKVKIISGQWWGTYGLSNFWDWKRILPDGTLSEETFHGYGWFTK